MEHGNVNHIIRVLSRAPIYGKLVQISEYERQAPDSLCLPLPLQPPAIYVATTKLPDGTLRTLHTLHIPVYDSLDAPLDAYFWHCAVFAARAWQYGNAVYVHCAEGISRSPTVVIAVIMLTEQVNVDAARKQVLQKRVVTAPNPEFERQLVRLDEKLRSLPDSQRRNLKTLLAPSNVTQQAPSNL